MKFMIGKNEYIDLKERIFDKNEYKSKIQVNYYYDTANNDLLKNNITLRVRQIEKNLMLQAKYPIKTDTIIRIKEEREFKINYLKPMIDLKDEEIINAIGDLSNYERANLAGSLVTYRMSINYNPGIKLELDTNLYLGKIDYELEVEIIEGYEEIAKKIIKDILPNKYVISKLGKMERFFEIRKCLF